MNQIVIESMQWSALTHIADVRPIGDDDAACLEDIRKALQKHGALQRFGLTLLHSHFDLADDETLLETTDLDRREQWVRPVKASFLEENGITPQTTVVAFDETGHRQFCGCNPRSSGHFHL